MPIIIQRKLTGYDNYAYSSRNIQPDEELSRRGYTMYDPYRNNNNQTSNVHQNSNNNNNNNSGSLNRFTKTKHIMQQSNLVEMSVADDVESRDEAEYAIANAETIVMTGNDVEMKIKTNYPPEFKGVPPPPAFANRFDIEENPTTTKSEEQK
ncbi:probable serine/threonine-protein kinase DDB_G0291350 isoform X3 [Contarinia nasturtii]|uniref:probable serine/threonine-protein kinase DDB_G0291350 isoform X3 n=1 Tax=Contarinia nasturtii TaxID=265458 RepID=UPI0012D41875|nr:probable serine/threonine-protein kinase DDB_G0291350 isoform X3 [Contarinia nasturtii]